MVNVLVRALPEETHVELKARAKKNARSVNAEIRSVLVGSARPAASGGLGTEFAKWKEKHLGEYDDSDFDILFARDKTPARYPDFSGPEYDWPESE